MWIASYVKQVALAKAVQCPRDIHIQVDFSRTHTSYPSTETCSMSRFVFKPPAAKTPDAPSTSGSLDSYLAATQEAEQALLLQQAAMAHAAVAPAQSSNLFAARFAGAAAAAGPASAAGPSLFAPAAAGGSLLAPSRFALPGFSEAAAAGPAAGAPPGVREPVRFNFDDLGGEVSEMAQQREQEIKDELNAARERVAVDAHAGMFAPLPSQDAESAALTAFVMDAMGRCVSG